MNFVRSAGAPPARPSHIELNVSRGILFACLGVVAALNAEAGQVLSPFIGGPIIDLVRSIGAISAVIWFGMFATLKIGFENEPTAPSKRDWLMASAIVALCLVPIFAAAKAALLLCGLYLMATSRSGESGRRIGAVLLALTGPLLWGPIILDMFGGPILSLDAHVVGAVIGSPVDGNIVQFAGETRRFLVALPCSSIHNISLALVLWTSAAALFQVRFDRQWVVLGCGMVLFMYLLNVVRLSTIGRFPASFVFLHDGAGADLFGWAAIAGVGVMAFLGVERAIRRQQ